MGGQGDNEAEKEDKIIKNIAKEIVINKFQISKIIYFKYALDGNGPSSIN